MFDATAGGGGGALLPRERAERSRAGEAGAGGAPRRGSPTKRRRWSSPDAECGGRPGGRMRARQIASRLAIPRPRRDATSRRGIGELGSLPYRGGSDDIDLDRTIEVLAERPVPEDEDIIVRDRIRTKRSVVLRGRRVGLDERRARRAPPPRQSARSPANSSTTTSR